jgi:hypothetical protein
VEDFGEDLGEDDLASVGDAGRRGGRRTWARMIPLPWATRDDAGEEDSGEDARRTAATYP